MVGPGAELSVDDRLFMELVRKNQLVSPSTAEQAVETARARRLPLIEVFKQQQLLDPDRLERVREALIASQILRLDSIYADQAHELGLVGRASLQQAFQEQRQQGYRVRLGNLLVQAGQLTPEQHRRVITHMIRRMRGRTEPDPELQTPVPPPVALVAPPPPPGEPRQVAFSQAGTVLERARTFQPLDETDPGSGLLTSALELRLSTVDALEEDDERLLQDDLKRADQLGEDFVLDRAALSSGERMSGSRAALRPLAGRGGPGSLLLALATACLMLLLVVGWFALGLAKNRRGVRRVRSLISQAEGTAEPRARQQRYLDALAELAPLGQWGIPEGERQELRDQATWGALEAEASAAMSAGQAAEGTRLLERRGAEIPPAFRAAADTLRRQLRRAELLAAAATAESGSALPAATAALRGAGALGADVEARLQRLRDRLEHRTQRALNEALATLTPADRDRFRRAADELIKSFPDAADTRLLVTGRRDLAFELALARGNADLADGRSQAARAAFDEALEHKPDDPEAQALRRQALQQLQIDRLLAGARESLRERRYDQARRQLDEAARLEPHGIPELELSRLRRQLAQARPPNAEGETPQ